MWWLTLSDAKSLLNYNDCAFAGSALCFHSLVLVWWHPFLCSFLNEHNDLQDLYLLRFPVLKVTLQTCRPMSTLVLSLNSQSQYCYTSVSAICRMSSKRISTLTLWYASLLDIYKCLCMWSKHLKLRNPILKGILELIQSQTLNTTSPFVFPV